MNFNPNILKNVYLIALLMIYVTFSFIISGFKQQIYKQQIYIQFYLQPTLLMAFIMYAVK